jgi:hypothetical protein
LRTIYDRITPPAVIFAHSFSGSQRARAARSRPGRRGRLAARLKELEEAGLVVPRIALRTLESTDLAITLRDYYVD